MKETMSIQLAYVLIRPHTLNIDNEYFLRFHQDKGQCPVYLPVRFVNYDPCPAMVVIRKGDGKLWKVPREDVFTAEPTIRD